MKPVEVPKPRPLDRQTQSKVATRAVSVVGDLFSSLTTEDRLGKAGRTIAFIGRLFYTAIEAAAAPDLRNLFLRNSFRILQLTSLLMVVLGLISNRTPVALLGFELLALLVSCELIIRWMARPIRKASNLAESKGRSLSVFSSALAWVVLLLLELPLVIALLEAWYATSELVPAYACLRLGIIGAAVFLVLALVASILDFFAGLVRWMRFLAQAILAIGIAIGLGSQSVAIYSAKNPTEKAEWEMKLLDRSESIWHSITGRIANLD